MQLVLFDIDGTLLAAQGVGVYAMERVGKKLLGESFTLNGIDFAGALDPWIFREAAGRMGHETGDVAHDTFHEAYIAELTRVLAAGEKRPELIDGVPAALAALSTLAESSPLTLGLVTGNYTRAVPLKLRAAGLDPSHFPIGAFGDEAPTRPGLVRLAMERWAAQGGPLRGERVIVIGDTPRDIDCAKKNGCRAIAVATGRHSMAELHGLGADHVVPSLHGLADLVRAFAGV